MTSVVNVFMTACDRIIRLTAALPPQLKMVAFIAALPVFILSTTVWMLSEAVAIIDVVGAGLDSLGGSIQTAWSGSMVDVQAIGAANQAALGSFSVTSFLGFINQLIPITEGMVLSVLVFNSWLSCKLYRLIKSYVPTIPGA